MNNQQGLGFPEVLISLFLASLIITALLNQYLIMKKHYLNGKHRVDESFEIKMVTDLMRDSVRRAGFTPCIGLNHLISKDTSSSSGSLSSFAINRDKQSLKMTRMSEYFDSVLIILNDIVIQSTRSYALHANKKAIIADCYHAEVITIKDVKKSILGQKINLVKPLNFTYQQPVYIGEWVEEEFYIRNQLLKKPALYYRQRRTDELTQAITSLLVKPLVQDNHFLLSIDLGLSNNNHMIIDTLVRSQ